MLLVEVEKQARKLSKSDKMRLIQDVQQWLKDENELPNHDIYPAVDVPELDKEFPSWKYDFDEMAKVADVNRTRIMKEIVSAARERGSDRGDGRRCHRD